MTVVTIGRVVVEKATVDHVPPLNMEDRNKTVDIAARCDDNDDGAAALF